MNRDHTPGKGGPLGDNWLTIKEAAATLRLHPQTIYSAIATLGLCHVRIGHGRGCIRIRQTWLDRWAESRMQTA